jgi:pyruvate dehydrogenase E2 component (dihydrolipoamide acetyltransferase)
VTSDLVMPRLSDTMEEGTILRWLKRDGEQVERGEELVEIETDKATMTYESDQAGILEIVAQEGDTLPVGEVIAHLGDAGTDPATRGQAPAAGPAATPVAPPRTVDRQPAAVPPLNTPLDSSSGDQPRVKASPLARRVAREGKVNLHELTGTGPGGRIVKADVQAAMPRGGAPETARDVSSAASPSAATLAAALPSPAGSATGAPSSAASEKPSTAKGESTIQELSRTQQAIARRMAESKATIPDFALQMEIDMEECVALRTELKQLSHPGAPTYNDMVIKACALALREFPRANGSYRDARFELHSRVNVGVAVAANDALVVPTVFDADVKSVGEIARETKALAERVRDGSITPPELGGGTFTVSNLGMYGVRSFTAVVNPPQAAILSVGSLEPRAVVRGHDEGSQQILVSHTMTVTLACDHRILYGADAAQFLARIRELLEHPVALTL